MPETPAARHFAHRRASPIDARGLALAVAAGPLVLLALACCFGAGANGTRAQVRGSVRDIDGAPVAGAHVVLMANDSASCPDCTGTGTTAETRSADDGTFTVEVGNFSVGGYDGIVEVDGGDEHGVLVTYHFPAPTYAQPTAPVDVTLYVDARPNPGPLDVDRSTLEPDPRYRIARDEAAGGLTICSPVALHRCTAVRGQDAAERRWLAVDVDATASCDTLVQDARARCGEGTEPATLGCLARAGLFHDAAAVPVSATPEPPSGGIELRCAEGSATAAGP